MINLALALTLAMPTLPAFAQKAMSKKEIAEKEKAFKNLQHPWKGKKVAYFGDSITDPNIKASKVKYWGFLQDWLGITPYVDGMSGRQWNDIHRQADQLQKENGDDFDAILIFMGTNDYNNGVPVGEWYTETFDSVRVARHKPSEMVQRRHRHGARVQAAAELLVADHRQSVGQDGHLMTVLLDVLRRGVAHQGPPLDEPHPGDVGKEMALHVSPPKAHPAGMLRQCR